MTWDQLNNYVHSTTRYLKEISVRPMARILVMDDKSPAYIILLLALWRIGAVPCPVLPATNVEYINAVCRLVEPAAAVGPRSVKKMWDIRWIDIEQVIVYGYNDSFLGSRASLDPEIDMDKQALLRLIEVRGEMEFFSLTHIQLRKNPGDLAVFLEALASGGTFILS